MQAHFGVRAGDAGFDWEVGSMIRRLCVFCGSNSGNDPRFIEAARELGQTLAAEGIGLVYGGASVGLMGAVADGALVVGGEVIGVMPRRLVEKEIAHKGAMDLRIVDSMHERKALMAELADGFVALPGGIGTFEELFEIWTWAQLGYHNKPAALLNVANYYDGLTKFLDDVTRHGFIKQIHRDMLIVADEVPALMQGLRAYSAPNVTKWIGAEER